MYRPPTPVAASTQSYQHQQAPVRGLPYPTMDPSPAGADLHDNITHYGRYDATAFPSSGVSIVKASVKICGTPVDVVIDFGASHSMMSETQARKLQLFKHIQRTTTRFFTPSGKLERPACILTDVPMIIGSLTLPTDVYVSHADSYNMLISNNFLAAAKAQTLYGAKELWVRKGIGQFDAIDFDFQHVSTEMPYPIINLANMVPAEELDVGRDSEACCSRTTLDQLSISMPELCSVSLDSLGMFEIELEQDELANPCCDELLPFPNIASQKPLEDSHAMFPP